MLSATWSPTERYGVCALYMKPVGFQYAVTYARRIRHAHRPTVGSIMRCYAAGAYISPLVASQQVVSEHVCGASPPRPVGSFDLRCVDLL